MDAFYASIEQRDNPALKGRPVIVGGVRGRRGVVCAASYEARRFGVRSAMPSSRAYQLCPQGVFLEPRMARYREESGKLRAIMGDVTPILEPLSLDEAYLDVTARLGEAPDAQPVEAIDAWLAGGILFAQEIKSRMKTEVGLTASVGVASNKFLAKIGSDFNKPDGLTFVKESTKAEFLRPLPVRAVFGVGEVTERILMNAGFRSIADLQDYTGDFRPLVGSFGPELREFAFGRDDRPVDTSDEIKSISTEETFEEDIADVNVLNRFMWHAAQEIEAGLHERGLLAATVQVRVRYGDFTTLTRQLTIQDPTDHARSIHRLGWFLLRKHDLLSRPLRLLGLGVSSLSESTARQLSLWEGKPPR